MVDADIMTLSALEEGDVRTLDSRVAGPAALLVAKVHKIDDRNGSERASDKDALDVLPLLLGTETQDLAAGYAKLLGDKRSEDAARRGCKLGRRSALPSRWRHQRSHRARRYCKRRFRSRSHRDG